MPLMPKQYSPELIQIIKNMLHQEPEKRPSVNRILRDSYIKKNISVFLEETKKRLVVYSYIHLIFSILLPLGYFLCSICHLQTYKNLFFSSKNLEFI